MFILGLGVKGMAENEKALLGEFEAWIAQHRQELVGDLIEMVNVRSVKGDELPGKPFGEGPANAIDKAMEIGKKYGFETDNDEYYNVSFVLPGATKRELGILGHIDVVPEGEGWSFPPYDAKEQEDHVLGRGAGDNKGPSVAALYVLRMLRDLGVKLNHSVRVIWGANEEHGVMLDVIHYAQTHTPPEFTLVCDAGFPVCYGEKGILSADLVAASDDARLLDFHGGIASNSVPDSAFIRYKGDAAAVRAKIPDESITVEEKDGAVVIAAKGVAGHAAFPMNSVNAIQKLARAVTDAGLFSGATRRAVRFIADAFQSSNGTGLDIECDDDIGTNTTHIGGMVRFEGGKIRQNINVRYAIHQDQDDLIRKLNARAAEGGFAVEDLENSAPRYDDPQDPKVKLLVEVSKEFVDKDAEPYLMGGGTHARKFPNAVPFGPGWPRESERGKMKKFGSAHAADEAV